MKNRLFRKEALEHKRERLFGEVILVQPVSFVLLSFTLILVVSLIIALLFWGNYARRETVTGYLVPDTGMIKVYPRATGTVQNSFVKEGSIVEIGDPLLTVSTGRSTQNTSDVDAVIISELNESERQLESKIVEEQALFHLELKKTQSQIKGLELELKQIKAQLATSKERFVLAQERVSDFDGLQQRGHVSDEQYQEQYEKLLDTKFIFNDTQRQLTSKENALEQAGYEVQQLPFRLKIRLTELRNAISEIKQRRLDIEGQSAYTLYAPYSGGVTALQAYQGKKLSIDSPVLAILPKGALFEAELFVPTRAIGFIKKKQKVMIRYAAFPFQRYGLHEGEIENVAEVILAPMELPVPVSINEPVYRVTVKLLKQHVTAYGQKMPLQAGMVLEADIILDSLSLVDWLLDPLYSLTGRL